MRMFARIGLLVAALSPAWVQPSFAACGPIEEVPSFADEIDRSLAPDLPEEPYSYPKLESFRAKLEIFRRNEVEEYNARLTLFGEKLKRIEL